MFKTGCIDKIYSVSAVLGGPACNANCPGCAGKVIRQDVIDSVANGGPSYNDAPEILFQLLGWLLIMVLGLYH